MSKSNNPTYIAERLARTKIRKATRKDKRADKYNRYGHGTCKCDNCGENMTWCSSCEVWSSYCCEEYGTCQCS